jgi:hypothetical protein
MRFGMGKLLRPNIRKITVNKRQYFLSGGKRDNNKGTFDLSSIQNEYLKNLQYT